MEVQGRPALTEPPRPSIRSIVSFLSQGSTLPAGTVLITGTPPGIGQSFTPAEWLKDGDDVRCSISHGLGTLANTIRYERP
jgi:2-keto-4-pentenoate hydratase/2-oxohepta-3-ene-1,7-dioic acid hydratase in catechol pathway